MMLFVIVALFAAVITMAITWPLFDHFMSGRIHSMFEDWKELRRAGVDSEEADRQVKDRWPWYRMK